MPPLQPPNHKHSVHKSSTVPSHSISPAHSKLQGAAEADSTPMLTAASTQLFTPVLSQQRLAEPSPQLCTPVSCCRAKCHCRGHTATDTIAQQGFRVPHVILARHCLPLEIGTFPKALGQVPARNPPGSLRPGPQQPSSFSFPNTDETVCSLQHSQCLSAGGGGTPKKSWSTATSTGMNVSACRRTKPEVPFQMQAGKKCNSD